MTMAKLLNIKYKYTKISDRFLKLFHQKTQNKVSNENLLCLI